MTIVPQRQYARKRGDKKQEVIIFKINGRSGITARDAMRKVYAGLEGRDERVFEGKCSVLTLRLEVRSVFFCEVFLMTGGHAVAWIPPLVSQGEIIWAIAIDSC